MRQCCEDEVDSDQRELTAMHAEIQRLNRERGAEQRRLDRALDFGVDADIRARYERLGSIDKQIEDAKREATKLESRIEAGMLPVEMPQQFAYHFDAIQLLHEKGDRARLRKALSLLIDSVVLSVDDAGNVLCQIQINSAVMSRRGSDERLYSFPRLMLHAA